MASNGVNVKMGVSGIAQFKQSMKQAQQSVKTLDAELALNEKQYKATGDAESYMETKAELLKKKLEEQKTAVANAEKALKDMNENGVDKASTAYQNMQTALAKAKGDLIDTETSLGNVYTAAVDADEGVSSMNSSLKAIGDGVSYQNVTDALGKITDGMGTVITKAWEVGKAIVSDVLGAGEWADNLSTLSKVYDIPIEDLQRMMYTADIYDTSVESIVKARDKLEKGIGGNDSGVAEAIQELTGSNVVSTDSWDAFWELGDAIMNLGDSYSQESYAQKIFGRSWHELVPLFESGREAVEELNNSWDVVPQDSIDKLTEMDDQYQILQNELEAVQRQFEAQLAPVITDVMGMLTDLLKEFNAYLQTDQGKEMMESLGNAVHSLFDDLSNIDTESVMTSVIDAIDMVKQGMQWISNNKDGVVDAVKGFVGAWGLFATAKGVATALELIRGIKYLRGGASAAAGAASAAGGGAASAATGAAAGAGGGFFATAGGKLASAVNTVQGTIGGALPFFYDYFMHNTTAGQTMQNGGSFWEGMQAQWDEITENVKSNSETFVEDWNEVFRNVRIALGLEKPRGAEGASHSFDPPEEQPITEESFEDLGYGQYTREQMEEAIQDWWDATQNANRGEDSLSEADAAQAWMEEVLGENFGDVWTEIAQKLDEVNQSKLEDIPPDWYSSILDAVVGDDDEPAAGLNSIPGKLAAAVTGALANVKVEIDGQAAGNILAPYVSENMGNILAALIKYGT